MSNYVTKRAESMMKGSDYSSESPIRQRKPRIQQNVWIPCYMNGCKEGIFTKNDDEMIIPSWIPLYGSGEIETGIIIDKPPYFEDRIIDAMLPNTTKGYKFADLVGKGAAIKVEFNGKYINLVDIKPLDEKDEAFLQEKNEAAAKESQKQHQDVEAFEEDMDAENDEQPKVTHRKGFGSSRSNKVRSNRKQAPSQEDEESLQELEDEHEEDLDLDLDENDVDLDLDEEDDEFDVDDDEFEDEDESESY